MATDLPKDPCATAWGSSIRVLALGALFAGSAGIGCGGDECQSDSDCPSLGNICIENTCRAPAQDAGGRDVARDVGQDVSTDPGTGTDVGTDAGAPQTGTVDLAILQLSVVVGARFGPADPSTVVTSVGPCEIYTVPSSPPPTDAGMPDGGPSDAGMDAGVMAAPGAGDIVFTRGMDTLVTLAPNSGTGLYPIQGGSPSPLPGDTVGIDAMGDDVPAFSTSLVVGPTLNVTSPGDFSTIDRNMPLTMTWDVPADTDGEFFLQILGVARPGEPTVSLLCGFPIDAGTATVPPTTLTMIPTGNPASLNIWNARTIDVTAGEWTVTVNLAGYATASGMPVSAIMTTFRDAP